MRKLLKFLFKRYILSSVLLFLIAILLFIPIELTPYSYNYTSFGTRYCWSNYDIEKLRDKPEVKGFLPISEHKNVMKLVADARKTDDLCNPQQARLLIREFLREALVVDEFGCYEKEGVSYKINKKSFHILKHHFDNLFFESYVKDWPMLYYPFPKFNRDKYNEDKKL